MILRNKDVAPKPTKRKIVVPIGEEKKEVISLEDLKSLELTKEQIKRITKKKDKVRGGVKDIEYTVYEASSYGKIANTFFGGLSEYFIENFADLYKTLKTSLIRSDIKLLSRTYVSVIFLSSIIGSFLGLFVSLIISYIFGVSIITSLLRGVGISFLIGVGTLIFLYFYPEMVAKGRNRDINNDLPFVIIHMAAVSGSGAQPISIFNLVLNTGDYKGLEREIRKIVNYVNLFGYDLTTALRNVAISTPSPRFRELLVGIVATLETGGDLRKYLASKADDALTTYKLERRRYIEILATYSDVYTGVLIAAPLLFITTLAIINLIGGSVLGFSAVTLAFAGTFFVIPFLNVAFLILLNFIQPES